MLLASLTSYPKIPEWNANLTWSTCPEAPDDPALSCTEFVIPLDWHDESVGLGKLGVVYYSVDPSQRVGSIFVNPGALLHVCMDLCL